MSAATPWQAGRLDASQGPGRLLFGQMYEDPEIERKAFQGRGRIFCIASAGDTAILLSQEHEVVACDINPVQLAYARRRVTGGPRETGDAERAMCLLRRFAPLAGWHEESIRAFLVLSDTGRQLEVWRSHFDTRRFRAGFDAIMSRFALRMIYSPRFLSALPARFGAVLRKRLEKGIAHHPNASNPYLHALLLGAEISSPAPQAANIEPVVGDAVSVLDAWPPASFSGFTLSNILDGVSPAYRQQLLRAVRRAATESAVVVLRSFAEPAPASATSHAEQDRSMLWGVVDIRRVAAL